MNILLTLAILVLLCVPSLVTRYLIIGDEQDVWEMSVLAGCAFWIVVGVGFFIYSVADDYRHPDPTITLTRADWQCTQSHSEHRLVGKIVANVQVCDVYERTK
jgi:hypothetical protein